MDAPSNAAAGGRARHSDGNYHGPRPSVLVRPGVMFPTWSVNDSNQAGRALAAIVGAFNLDKCFARFGTAEDKVRQAVLRLYKKLGHAPSPVQLTEATGLGADRLDEVLQQLSKRDLVVLDETGTAVAGAYPFTERDTGHRVHLGVRTLNAMCAIDALGAGAMFGEDVVIQTSCRHCDRSIRISTSGQGTELSQVLPDETLVWSGIEYQDCAATSLCTVLVFFCCEEHLRSWRAQNPGPNGFQLSLDEAMQVGKAIFMDVLTPGSSPTEKSLKEK